MHNYFSYLKHMQIKIAVLLLLLLHVSINNHTKSVKFLINTEQASFWQCTNFHEFLMGYKVRWKSLNDSKYSSLAVARFHLDPSSTSISAFLRHLYHELISTVAVDLSKSFLFALAFNTYHLWRKSSVRSSSCQHGLFLWFWFSFRSIPYVAYVSWHKLSWW